MEQVVICPTCNGNMEVLSVRGAKGIQECAMCKGFGMVFYTACVCGKPCLETRQDGTLFCGGESCRTVGGKAIVGKV